MHTKAFRCTRRPSRPASGPFFPAYHALGRRALLVEHQRRYSGVGRDGDFVESVRWARPYARQATHATLLNHHNGSFLVLPSFRIELQRKKGFKRAVHDAKVATRAVVLDDRNHGLTHGMCSMGSAIMLCLRKTPRTGASVVKFIGASHQHPGGADVNEWRWPP